jgi:hypothetical protein
MPPTAPDVRSSDESESNISPNIPEYDGESEGQQRVLLMPPTAPNVRSSDESESSYRPTFSNTMANLRANDELEKKGTN